MSAFLSSSRAPAHARDRASAKKEATRPAREGLPREATPSQRTKRVLADSDELQEWQKEAARVLQRKQRRFEPAPADESPREEETEAVSKGEQPVAGTYPPDEPSSHNTDKPSLCESEGREEPRKKAMQTLSTLRGLKLPPPPKRLKPPDAPLTKNDRSSVKRPPAAIFDLSSLAPVSLPTTRKASRPPVSPRNPVRQAEPLSRLSALIPPVQIRREGAQQPDRKPAQALTSLKPPPVSEIALGNRANEEVETEEWSPKKRKAGYLA